MPGSADDSEPGSASKAKGSGTSALNFGATSASFVLEWIGDSVSVELSTTFANFDALVAELNSQVKAKFQRLNVSHNAGVISIIEAQSPQYGYTGSPIRITGTSGSAVSRVFGGSVIYTDGSPTTGRWIGPFKATPGNETARGFEIDLFAQNGLGIVDDETGAIGTLSRQVEIQWWAGDGASGSQQLTFSGATRDQIGATYGIDIGAERSHVYFRARRMVMESTDSLYYDRIYWYGLKARLGAPSSYAGVTTLAVALDGSDEISSASDSKINLIVTRMFNIGEPTRRISDWVRYVCTDVGYSVDDIENSELDALQQNWDARGDYFDYVVDSQSTVKAELARALRAGFAELTLDHGKIRPVRDHARTDYEQMYTPQNMTSALQKSFSAYDPDDHDGVDVKYVDPNTWEEETVYCRLPGDIGARAETIEADGICDRTRAWRLGMRQRRAQRYRRRTLKFSTELDALNSRYLSYCLVCDDVPGYARSAILIDYTENGSEATLTSSEPLPWVDGASHVCALRRPDGTASGPYAATRLDDYRLSIPIPDFEPVTGGSWEPTHILFGTTTRYGYPVLITEIAPKGTTQVDVTAIGYDPRVYDDDNNSPT
ncbi:MAG: phage tail protein [Sphingobacterium sp.]|nr:phage tail protein [Sphingobacterium sp.]